VGSSPTRLRFILVLVFMKLPHAGLVTGGMSVFWSMVKSTKRCVCMTEAKSVKLLVKCCVWKTSVATLASLPMLLELADIVDKMNIGSPVAWTWYVPSVMSPSLSVCETHNAAELTGPLAQQRGASLFAIASAQRKIDEINSLSHKKAEYVNFQGQKIGSIINDQA